MLHAALPGEDQAGGGWQAAVRDDAVLTLTNGGEAGGGAGSVMEVMVKEC